MGALARRVRWVAAAVGAGVLATYLFPVVVTVLSVALYASWVVIAVLLLRAVPVPARVRSRLPVVRGHAQRAAATVGAWLSLAPAWSGRRPGGGRQPQGHALPAMVPALWLLPQRCDERGAEADVD